jgi:anti-sigma B factor antagonist
VRIETRNDGRAIVIEVKERRIDARNAADLKDRIASLVTGGAEWLVLDLSDVELVDSTGLGAIVASVKLLGGKGELAIANARGPVREFFATTRMDRVFRMVATT